MPDIQLLHMDCMDYMANLEDNAFELAIVDPPYGQGDMAAHTPRKKGGIKNKIHAETKWNTVPNDNYFTELFRVSKNQIIWGANHYTKNIPNSRGWIFWDKIYENTFNFSAGELAYTSFDRVLKMFRCSQRCVPSMPLNIHPTQKPVKLYEWILSNYANEDDRILDTHLGSGSSAIAAHYGGYDFVGMEIDGDYYNAATNRFTQETRQLDLLGVENA